MVVPSLDDLFPLYLLYNKESRAQWWNILNYCFGLGVWVLLRVQEVVGSNPFLGWFVSQKSWTKFQASKSIDFDEKYVDFTFDSQMRYDKRRNRRCLFESKECLKVCFVCPSTVSAYYRFLITLFWWKVQSAFMRCYSCWKHLPCAL